jgi:hypothetical protein
MNIATAKDRDLDLDDLAAELTNAAYPVVLRHGAGEKWLDLELDLWKVLCDTLRRLEQIEEGRAASCCASPRTSDCLE